MSVSHIRKLKEGLVLAMGFDFWRRYPGRFSGAVLGLFFGILTIVLGFWPTVYVFFCAVVGYLLAWYVEQFGGWYGFLDHLLRRR